MAITVIFSKNKARIFLSTLTQVFAGAIGREVVRNNNSVYALCKKVIEHIGKNIEFVLNDRNSPYLPTRPYKVRGRKVMDFHHADSFELIPPKLRGVSPLKGVAKLPQFCAKF